ncbi:MAG: ABC transporter permease [Chloroflexota bacterium]|nr:ABC transporter permease [Chloroflexota bacterium]
MLLALVAFVAVRTAPGGPAYVLLGAERSTPEAVARVNEQLGLDRPLPEQLLVWVGTLAHGDFGFSYFFRRPALEIVQERFLATFILGGCAWLLSSAAGVGAGVWSARGRGSWIDRCLSSGEIALLATPSFWLGILLIVIFAAWLRVLPSAGLAPVGQENDLVQRARYLLLPLLTMAAPHAASLALYTRASMLDALSAEYVRTARAKGASEVRVAWAHALRNAAIPVVTMIGLNIPHLVEGSVIVESVFSWPGIGQLTVASIGRRDYPVLLAITLLVALIVVLANVLTDLVYHAVDPRIEYS